MNKKRVVEQFEINTKHQKEAFINAFKEIANKAMNEHLNNILKQPVVKVKKPDQTKEELI